MPRGPEGPAGGDLVQTSPGTEVVMSTKLTRRSTLGLMVGAAAIAMPNVVRAQTVEVVAHYSMPPIFKAAMEAVAEAFNKKSDKVKVTYVNPTPTYEDGAQLVLRQATTGGLPDVSFQGLNRLRLFAERVDRRRPEALPRS
jgi:multiple sugar transport system substrate-binding protein